MGVGTHAHGVDEARDGDVGLDAKGDTVEGAEGLAGGVARGGGAGGGEEGLGVDVEPGEGVGGWGGDVPADEGEQGLGDLEGRGSAGGVERVVVCNGGEAAGGVCGEGCEEGLLEEWWWSGR